MYHQAVDIIRIRRVWVPIIISVLTTEIMTVSAVTFRHNDQDIKGI
jgi:hypothetical protein